MDLQRARHLLHLLDAHQVGDRADHAPDLGPVLLDDDVVQALQAQGAQRLALRVRAPDAEGAPAYLECSKERNVSFYARFGFKVTKELNTVIGGPRIWLMWREPRPVP